MSPAEAAAVNNVAAQLHMGMPDEVKSELTFTDLYYSN